MGLSDQIGPVDDGGLDCDHPAACGREAVAIVPDPTTVGGLRLCPFHLGLWSDVERGSVEILERIGVDDRVADDRFYRIDQAPPRLDRGAILRRIGIDHRGLAHYSLRSDRSDLSKVLTLDRDLELLDVYPVPESVDVDDWIEHVRERRGWVRVDDRRLVADGGTDRGDTERQRRSADTTGWSVFGYPGNKAKHADGRCRP